MLLRHWQLIFAVFWGSLALLAALRETVFSPEALQRLPLRDGTLPIALGLLMMTWNLVRWWQAQARRAATPARLPLQPRPEARGGYEYNPELDFQKSDPLPPAPKD